MTSISRRALSLLGRTLCDCNGTQAAHGGTIYYYYYYYYYYYIKDLEPIAKESEPSE
jgi:hypothetical protein